ncbi:hypothetical protein [Halococcus agarilyticus]|uniref:hypothetical protein n=1 Tax=Halococcus agarilyticus TaxID=1232219 RepID=UPI000677AF23|nr:hypothetical protein [Halococcus agarilyticus]
MSRAKLALRFVVALVAFTALVQPLLALFTPPDAYLTLVAAGIAGLVAVPTAIVFVRQSRSLERLGKYFLAVNVLVVLTALVAGGLRVVARPLVGHGWTAQTLFNLTAIVPAYALAFHLVYRGGYNRLKARFA